MRSWTLKDIQTKIIRLTIAAGSIKFTDAERIGRQIPAYSVIDAQAFGNVKPLPNPTSNVLPNRRTGNSRPAQWAKTQTVRSRVAARRLDRRTARNLPNSSNHPDERLSIRNPAVIGPGHGSCHPVLVKYFTRDCPRQHHAGRNSAVQYSESQKCNEAL